MKRVRCRRGYTLVEAMIVVTLIGILSFTGPQIMVQFQNFYLMTTARNDMQRDARTCVGLVARFLSQAYYRSIVIDTPNGEEPYSRLQFTHVDGRQFIYKKTGKQFIQTVNGENTVISGNVLHLGFMMPRSDEPGVITVAIGMSKGIQLGKSKSFDLTIEKIRVMN